MVWVAAFTGLCTRTLLDLDAHAMAVEQAHGGAINADKKPDVPDGLSMRSFSKIQDDQDSESEGDNSCT